VKSPYLDLSLIFLLFLLSFLTLFFLHLALMLKSLLESFLVSGYSQGKDSNIQDHKRGP